MKKRMALLGLMLCVVVPFALVGCTNSDTSASNEKAPTEQAENKDAQEKPDEKAQDSNEATPEKEEYPALQKALLEDLQLSDEDAAQTRYYYEKVDLNGDNKPEVLALVVGPTVSGTGGSPMYIFQEDGDNLKLVQDFSLIQPPVYLSKNKTGDFYDMYVEQSGGGAKTQWKVLKYNNGKYNGVEEGEAIEVNDSDVQQKMFTEDMAKDLENQTGLYLKPAQSK